MDELDRIGNRVSTGTKKRGYASMQEDDYSDVSGANSVCCDSPEERPLPGPEDRRAE